MTRQEQHQRREAIVQAAKNGATLAELVEQFRMSPVSIWSFCQHLNLPKQPRGPRKSETDTTYKVLALLLNRPHLSQARVGQLCNVSRARVNQIKYKAIRAGVKLL